MKTNIHPQFYSEVVVSCTSCGNKFTTGSTKQSIIVEVCFKCHPFFTGEHRFLDVKGRVDTFQKKVEMAKKYKAAQSSKKHAKKQKESKSLKDLLSEI
ncbi:50S ribosomal protein L31 [Candidatus Roizmanbacteria bacterium RIFCSPLOWO2_01_FULL_37_12]|uniref:Large ribosomal subunit protein bL31 n=1 Tax=Candidatus Roizmanbacteria bacterium RIFCSPLOWO2_01_FULL_37_12 TaxID=1802056 RepID=A0A1F7IAE8_9BACT|nr:MAG: 50S ribosomal protein L31 [Candidatus Roizmanbacteria bacterium RIFCSPHIGHO2_02_FULL_37_9b]OGK40333.1 MAG: 50S ribosomal protein L31 [Candidatus Roizmanbacteria bacterium RIFCSPLOWO2_01_FULL_37_12]